MGPQANARTPASTSRNGPGPIRKRIPLPDGINRPLPRSASQIQLLGLCILHTLTSNSAAAVIANLREMPGGAILCHARDFVGIPILVAVFGDRVEDNKT
jgi:hypothetical protein